MGLLLLVVRPRRFYLGTMSHRRHQSAIRRTGRRRREIEAKGRSAENKTMKRNGS
jgi:hypothetical protein